MLDKKYIDIGNSVQALKQTVKYRDQTQNYNNGL